MMFPKHITDLAQSIRNWCDCRFALHDALLEIGCPLSADLLLNNGMIFYSGMGYDDEEPEHSRSFIVGVILGESLWMRYLNKHKDYCNYQELWNYCENS